MYVVRMFIASIAANNERMWQGLQAITTQWLTMLKDSNDVNRELAREIGAQAVAMRELTAAINRSIEAGHNLNGAAGLMKEVLTDHGVKKQHEAKR